MHPATVILLPHPGPLAVISLALPSTHSAVGQKIT